MEHIITLQSNVKELKASNTIANFVTPLSQRLKLDGNWVVGISEIQYTKSWYNIVESSRIKFIAKSNFNDETWEAHFTTDSDSNILISEGYYETEEQLIETLNIGLESLNHDNPPTIDYNKLSKKISINPGKAKNEVLLFPSFGDEIDSMIGLRSDINGDYAFSTKSGIYEPIHPVEITRGYHSMYIYSNIVHLSHIGDTFSQILRVVEVPNEKKFGDDIVIRYENPQYRSILFDEISNIEINIKDDTNELILFKFGRVRIDLHFKKL